MGASFSAEMAKLIRRPAIWIIVGIWILLNVAFGVVIPDLIYTYAHGMNASDRQDLVNSMVPRGFLGNAIGSLPLFGGALVIILGAMIFGSEFGWGTFPTNFIRRPGRLSVLSGFFIAMAVF